MLYWIYAFNWIVNSFLCFFTTLLLIEFFVWALRIKDPRAKVICRALPFCKICLDLFLYRYSNWALVHEVNPLFGEPGTRRLSLMVKPWMGIELSMSDGKTFTLADVIALSIDPFWIRGIVVVAGIGSCIGLAWQLYRIFRSRAQAKRLLGSCAPCNFPVCAPLQSWMRKKKACLALSSVVTTPCLIGKTIVFPVDLLSVLSQEEREAVIAHEMAHLTWRDCLLRLFCSLVSSLFWWIPMRGRRKRIEEMQEAACDAKVHHLPIAPSALARAIVKTARNQREAKSLLVMSFVERHASLKARMQLLLLEPCPQALKYRILRYGLLAMSLLSILFGKLWIF